MCTSIVIETVQGNHNLARTMDFAFELNGEVIIIPRKFKWEPSFTVQDYKKDFGFIGMGRDTLDGYIFADGLNEYGLSCASLYFPEYATYSDNEMEGKINLAPHEFVYWILSNFTTVEEIKETIANIHFVAKSSSLLGVVLPLHWVVLDAKGNSIVIEPTASGVHVYENTMGVMTNSPDYSWHLTNLRNYIGIQSKQTEKMTLNGMDFKPFGQGLGTRGLPGDYTPPSRFVRAVYAKATMTEIKHSQDGVYEIFHLLSSVNIPKGSVTTSDNSSDYTQYTSCMSSKDLIYYTQTYYSLQIKAIQLNENVLDAKKPQHFDVLDRKDTINYLNE